MSGPYPCPCCGHLVFEGAPGSYDICPICYWEDDTVQLRWPDWAGCANRPSLIESQTNYAKSGGMEARFTGHVRPPASYEHVDEGWRPIDPDLDHFERRGVQETGWPEDLTVLYWWRPTFWRK